MRTLMALLFLLVLPRAAVAQLIGVYSDSVATSCNLAVPFPAPSVDAYIVFTSGNGIDGDPLCGVSGRRIALGMDCRGDSQPGRIIRERLTVYLPGSSDIFYIVPIRNNGTVPSALDSHVASVEPGTRGADSLLLP